MALRVVGGADQLTPTHLSRALARVCVCAGLEARIRKVFQEFDDAKAKELVIAICNIVAVGRKVSVFGLGNSDGSDLDKSMLQAILGNMPTKPLQTGVDDAPISDTEKVKKSRSSVTGSLRFDADPLKPANKDWAPSPDNPFYRVYIGVCAFPRLFTNS